MRRVFRRCRPLCHGRCDGFGVVEKAGVRSNAFGAESLERVGSDQSVESKTADGGERGLHQCEFGLRVVTKNSTSSSGPERSGEGRDGQCPLPALQVGGGGSEVLGDRTCFPSFVFAAFQSDRAFVEVREKDLFVFLLLPGLRNVQAKHFELPGEHEQNP